MIYEIMHVRKQDNNIKKNLIIQRKLLFCPQPLQLVYKSCSQHYILLINKK
jgi:hypothetical protein